MELMILNVCVNIHLKNTIEIIKCVKDKNVQNVKVLPVLGLVHADKSIKSIIQLHKHFSKEKSKTNQ